MGREFYTSDRVNINEVYYGIIEGIQTWNTQKLPLRESLCRDADMSGYKRDAQRNRWQLIGELERGTLTQKTFDLVTPSFDMYTWEEGWTVEGLAMKKYMDVLQDTQESLIAHDELVTGKIMQQLLRSTGSAFNADGYVPAPFANNTFDGTHTHLAVQSEISLSNLIDNRNHIREHGYNNIVVYMNTDEYTELLKQAQGASDDSNPNTNMANIWLSQLAIKGEVGSYAQMSFVETDFMPSGYYAMVGQGSGLGAIKPLKFHQIPTLEEILFIEGKGGLNPLDGAKMKHDFGLTTVHRGAIYVVQIGNTGDSYVEPTLNYVLDA